MRYCLSFLIIGCFFGNIASQDNSILFKRLSTSDGLSQNWVRYIYKDDIGFMWFGTADGLNRYDGKNFKTYRPKTFNKKEIGDINVSAICKKSETELWVGTDLGLYVYSYKTDNLEPYPAIKSPLISTIFQSKDNTVWFGTNNGLIKYDLASKYQILYVHDSNNHEGLSNNYVNLLFEDSYSNIWIGTKGGLNVYDTKLGKFRNLKIKGLPAKNLTNDIMSICEDHNHRIWLGYSQDGLFYFKNSLSENIDLTKFYDGYILSLIVDIQNRLWVGKGNDQGLDRIDLKLFNNGLPPTSVHYKNDPLENRSLSDNSIFSLFQDDLGDIWIGTFGKGLNFYSERIKKFYAVKAGLNTRTIKHNLVNAIIDDGNKLYIGFDGGLNIMDKKTGIYQYFSHDPENANCLSSSAVYSLFKDSRGNLWVGTWMGGLNLFNAKNGTFKHYLPDGKVGSISNANVFSITEDSRGYLWVGTIGGGLNRYDYKTDKFTCYKNNPNDSSSLNFNMVNSICETHDKRLFVSVYNSLDEFDYEHENFIHHKHDYTDPQGNFGNITSVFEDSNHTIWLATNCGLEYFDTKKGVFYSYTTNDGLPDNTIQGILEDNDKNLWISTNKGISKFLMGTNRPSHPVFHNYTQDDGLAGNESKRRATFKANDGRMYFGSSNGFTYFYPDSVKLNPYAPKVIITRLSFLHATKGNEIGFAINLTDTVAISYKNADFSIQFAALNYLNPNNNLFRYKLEGYDKDWINSGNQQIASYTNIHPGTYTFLLTASNNDNIWNNTPKKLIIIIHPPWWKTLIFKIILTILILFLIVVIYHIRFRVLEIQKRSLERVVKERTNELSNANSLLEERQEEISIQNEELSNHRNNLEQLVEERTAELEAAKIKAEASDNLKSAFLANMSHEIRTPMNAIVGFSSLLNDQDLTEDQKKLYIDIINGNSQSLLALIDDILDISLIESNQLVFIKQTFNVNKVLTDLESYYSGKTTENVEVKFIRNGELCLDNDPVRFRQIFNNLLNNALKYTEKGLISFGFKIVDQQVNFFVSDTGIGIAPDDCTQIFNHFYKVEKERTKLYRGTGIGLSICKKMVELMGGEIWVESVLNVGTNFQFNLPLTTYKTLTAITETDKEKTYDFKGIRLLIAEDEQDNFRLLSVILAPFGPELFWAKNGKEALDFVKGLDSYDNMIILMDIKMPIMDGYEANNEIKRISSKIPVIAVTAYAQASDKQFIAREQFNDYISKPIKQNILLDVISKYVPK